MSWQSKLIWEFIKSNYNKFPDKVPTIYREALKQNMANFMYILRTILGNCPNYGEDFLVNTYLVPNYPYFKYTYRFNEKGEIISQEPRHYTDMNQYETDRYRRIAIESVYDYSDKNNRNNKHDLTVAELSILTKICSIIESGEKTSDCKQMISQLVESIERRIISSL